MKKIIFLLPYFGKWPIWMNLYLDSLRRNPTIDFLFITDCDTSILDGFSNIHYQQTSFEEYVSRYKNLLGHDIQIPNAYKLCDLRPFYGVIHKDDIKDYDFFGWTDLDLFFGDIRSFYTEEILNKYEVISSHEIRLAGHCALLKNTKKYREMGYKVYDWEGALKNPNFVGIDEHGLTNALKMTIFDRAAEKFKFSKDYLLLNLLRKWKARKYYFEEQYTTPFISISWLDGSTNSHQPSEWFYEQGEITNTRDVGRIFMYLHLMNFKGNQWRHDGTPAPWKESFIYEVTDLDGKIKIDREGIRNV